MDPLQLREERAAIITEAETLLTAANEADEGPSEETQTKFDELMARSERMAKQIEQLEKVATAKAALAEPVEQRAAQPGPGEPERPAEKKTIRISAPRPHLRAFRGPRAEEDAHLSGMFLKAMYGNEQARSWCRDNGVPYEQRVMEEGTNTAGGYTVPSPLSDTVITLLDEFGVARQVCDVIPMTSDVLTIPKQTARVTGYWVGESPSGGVTASDQTYGAVTLSAKTLAALTRVTRQLLEDSAVNLADRIARDMAIVFADKEDDAWINWSVRDEFKESPDRVTLSQACSESCLKVQSIGDEATAAKVMPVISPTSVPHALAA